MTLRHVGSTAVPAGAKAGFDHADTYLHPSGSRLYVAHTGADRLDVFDCKSGTYLRSIPGFPGVAGVLIDRDADLLFTSDRNAARVSVLRSSDEAMLGQVAVDPRPNGLAFDRNARNLYSSTWESQRARIAASQSFPSMRCESYRRSDCRAGRVGRYSTAKPGVCTRTSAILP